jgi:hypothetical protein
MYTHPKLCSPLSHACHRYENLVPTPAIVFGDLVVAPGESRGRSVLHQREIANLAPSPASAIQDGCVVSREFAPHVMRSQCLNVHYTDSHFLSQSTPAQIAVGSDLLRRCEGIISRTHALAQELSSLPLDQLSAKWAPVQTQGED